MTGTKDQAGDWPQQPIAASAFGGRCPRCGQGALFSGFLSIADRCTVCGLDLRHHDSGDGPAYIIGFVLSIAVIALVMLVEFTLAPPTIVHIMVWPVVILGGTLGTLRPAKGALVALQYRHRSTEEPLGH